MTTAERIEAALLLAKQGDFHTARNIILLAEGHVSRDQTERAWKQFAKYWRAQ